jgi:predicted PolB exonuclease-like 3'-5' exonuclease
MNISKATLKTLLFFDIETCGQHPDIHSLADDKGPGAVSMFEKKIKRLHNGSSWTGDIDADYKNNVSLFPEFGRIACVSYGMWNEAGVQVMTVNDSSEYDLLKKVANLFYKAGTNGYTPTGWNIKNFDVPWLVRRMLMHGITVPQILSSYGKKPWEMNIFDMKDYWKSGSSLDVTFEEAAYGMGIPTPKDDIDGSQVHGVFWSGDIQRVSTYCEKDVKTMILLAEKISNIYEPIKTI